LFRSFRYLVTRPGALTVAYIKGQRKAYVGPVSLFLIINVLFFATESLTGGKVFTTPLESHLRTQPWSSDAVQNLVARAVDEKGKTLASYAPIFDQAVALKARSLIIFMALLFSPAPSIVFYRRHRPLVAHVVFALHLYSFLLLLLCVATTVPAVSAWWGWAARDSESLDHGISIGLLIASAVYLYLSAEKVYAERGSLLVLKTGALTVAVATVLLGYRFILLWITLYST
ncbi:MAG TPA: DUF3667 domain-containing protein, partial [Terriglobia bacterium]|nr:DUF3667 domain-containing protein [Terriglobia bacterium]